MPPSRTTNYGWQTLIHNSAHFDAEDEFNSHANYSMALMSETIGYLGLENVALQSVINLLLVLDFIKIFAFFKKIPTVLISAPMKNLEREKKKKYVLNLTSTK